MIVTIGHKLRKWEPIQETESFVNSRHCFLLTIEIQYMTRPAKMPTSCLVYFSLSSHALCFSCFGVVKSKTFEVHVRTKEV